MALVHGLYEEAVKTEGNETMKYIVFVGQGCGSDRSCLNLKNIPAFSSEVSMNATENRRGDNWSPGRDLN
jgi:hypothetical protein